MKKQPQQLGAFSASLLGFCCCNLSINFRNLGALFSDHMVLQRKKPVTVWGWANSGERVAIAFAGQTKTAKPKSDGG